MTPTFTIKASPGTDVWRKPPTTDVFNAPTSSPENTKSTSPLSTFLSARVSFLLPSTLKQYDQAGLLLSLRPRTSTAAAAAAAPAASSDKAPDTASPPPPPPKWIKAGVENYNGTPRAATVACDAWSDWSLAPVVVTTTSGEENEGNWVTIAVESGEDELGRSLWVYQVVVAAEGKEDKVPLREVCWPFGHGGGAEDWEVKVEAYACRPNKETSEELEAQFRGFEVKWV
ncbi:hypothetical protein M406DRAFT_288263 [Cryphonectria parasitica EP155]|uniref:Uncharacterized protein n=1 Tax=Cryphonectria parasitica (strain ATCC 38755 / EP155) TaxID=660469 RepID=A0A9P4Y5V8_CRYP1|nr:uncharacterized protein M406DRAFT_288263 [Cryphonectria parasitica EP155]KAF3767278.1 hypothetical protein M406DRAFT_288263 [Cryphonectria parasitica EP155]